ncbi:unnamed protein product [Pleuronectes platessa]|uniref:Uncharacterized protein n=1 Tax=Pleuronectes platessa TaxID=8262 RepID=A0A9N7UXU9_PLEPL|nr:unnamed protein product [Pleuronectes platessa]
MPPLKLTAPLAMLKKAKNQPETRSCWDVHRPHTEQFDAAETDSRLVESMYRLYFAAMAPPPDSYWTDSDTNDAAETLEQTEAPVSSCLKPDDDMMLRLRLLMVVLLSLSLFFLISPPPPPPPPPPALASSILPASASYAAYKSPFTTESPRSLPPRPHSRDINVLFHLDPPSLSTQTPIDQ